jgi:hypothetical protein
VITHSDAQGLRDHEQQVSETATNNCIPQPEPETGTSLHCRTSSSHQPCLLASLMRVSPFQEVQQQFYGTAPAHKFVVVSAKQTSLLTYKHIQTSRKMKAFPKKNTVLRTLEKKSHALEACYQYMNPTYEMRHLRSF